MTGFSRRVFGRDFLISRTLSLFLLLYTVFCLLVFVFLLFQIETIIPDERTVESEARNCCDLLSNLVPRAHIRTRTSVTRALGTRLPAVRNKQISLLNDFQAFENMETSPRSKRIVFALHHLIHLTSTKIFT